MNPPPPSIFIRITPDVIGSILHTRMDRFESVAGIDGLLRDNGYGHLELLAVHANNLRTGQFRTFIKQCQQHYRSIVIWHITNPFLPSVLKRYGFDDEVTVDEFGDPVIGMRWDCHPKTPEK